MDGAEQAWAARPETALLPQHAARVVIDPGTGCWLWTGARCSGGYAIARLDGRTQRVGRWLLVTHGCMPAGYVVDHVCRERACVAPAHLEAVSPRLNWARGESPSARWHRENRCHRGHDLLPPGAITVYRGGQRLCTACVRLRRRARTAAAA